SSIIIGPASAGNSKQAAFGQLCNPTPACYDSPESFCGEKPMSVHEHKERGKRSIRFFVVTVSDTRDESSDTSGQTIRDLLQRNQHEIIGYRIVKDEPKEIENLLTEALGKDNVDAVIVNGGTGIAPRDGTYEVVSRFLEKKLDGFGEIFRYLSYLEIGSAAIISRAAAGSARGEVLDSLPGFQAAVKLAMKKLVVSEIRHMVSQVQGK